MKEKQPSNNKEVVRTNDLALIFIVTMVRNNEFGNISMRKTFIERGKWIYMLSPVMRVTEFPGSLIACT